MQPILLRQAVSDQPIVRTCSRSKTQGCCDYGLDHQALPFCQGVFTAQHTVPPQPQKVAKGSPSAPANSMGGTNPDIETAMTVHYYRWG